MRPNKATEASVCVKAFKSAYPGSMYECAEGSYVERADVGSMAAALLEAIADRDRQIKELRGALQDIRVHLHAAGRRPQECYEMSVIDDTLKGYVRDSLT